MPSLSRNIEHESDTARKILMEVKHRVMASERRLQTKHKKWREAEEKVLAYLPEREVDAKRRIDRENGLPSYTTIQIPYTYAVLLSAHTYITSVFFGRNPVFQFSGRHGETEQNTQALEAVIGYQSLVGQWLVPLYSWIYDAGKYGVGVVGQYWEERVEMVTRIAQEEQLDVMGRPTGKKTKVQRTEPVKAYSGNKIYNVQPWDFLPDVRHPLRDFQKGEYCGVRFALAWNECKRREKQGYYFNLDQIKSKRSDYYASNPGSDQLDRPEATNGYDESWVSPDEQGKKHPMLVRGYEVYVELIPKEWGLGESDWPEKWVFTCTSDFSVLIGAAPLGALHCKFPFDILPLECEAYGLVTRGIPETLEPIQHTIDWLLNSHFYNVRAALNNKFVVDPSRLVMKDVLNPLPGGVIRMKPSAYGTNAKDALMQVQVGDVTRTHLNDLQLMYGMGERAVGVNDQIMGMLNTGGGRKTATEIRTSTSFGVNRLKTTAEWFSIVGFEPMAMKLTQSTQQYYDGEQQFKIAGDLLGSANARYMQVTPDMIAGAYDYVPVDGTLPIDRFAQANLWRELMAQMRNFPQLMMGYDMTRIFEWVAQLAGLKNITQFKIQMTPDEQLMLAAQAGNAVPLGGGAKPNSTSGFPQPKQMSGMGAM